jgi:hypothetical protein
MRTNALKVNKPLKTGNHSVAEEDISDEQIS